MPQNDLRQLPWYARLDRKAIYIFVVVALAFPLLLGLSQPAAPLPAAKRIFDKVEAIARERDEALAAGRPYRKAVLVVVDWGPYTRAECYPQTECIVRHLMARRIPFVIMTLLNDGVGYTREIPWKLAHESEHAFGFFGTHPGGGFIE